jgi:trans-aconitate 2-methyltransferase
MAWNPEQYLKFAQPRLRPAVDLLARIAINNPGRIVDLGCGAGNVTRLLAERWPFASLTGVDDSREMLAQAAKELPRVSWINQSIADWKPDTALLPDLIYSNAALHWLPNHATLFPTIMNCLASGGTLAVQMPRNFLAPSHTSIAETVNAGPWHDRLAHLLIPPPVSDPQFYFQLLAPFARSIDIWESEYLQVLSGPDPVKEWVKGTWLKQFLDALPVNQRDAFESDYAQRLRKAYPPLGNGTTLFPFRRLFIVAEKS